MTVSLVTVEQFNFMTVAAGIGPFYWHAAAHYKWHQVYGGFFSLWLSYA